MSKNSGNLVGLSKLPGKKKLKGILIWINKLIPEWINKEHHILMVDTLDIEKKWPLKMLL